MSNTTPPERSAIKKRYRDEMRLFFFLSNLQPMDVAGNGAKRKRMAPFFVLVIPLEMMKGIERARFEGV